MAIRGGCNPPARKGYEGSSPSLSTIYNKDIMQNWNYWLIEWDINKVKAHITKIYKNLKSKSIFKYVLITGKDTNKKEVEKWINTPINSERLL